MQPDWKKVRVLSKFEQVKTTGKRTFGRHRRRWENNIRMDLEKIDVNMRNWVDSELLESRCQCNIEPSIPYAMELFSQLMGGL